MGLDVTNHVFLRGPAAAVEPAARLLCETYSGERRTNHSPIPHDAWVSWDSRGMTVPAELAQFASLDGVYIGYEADCDLATEVEWSAGEVVSEDDLDYASAYEAVYGEPDPNLADVEDEDEEEVSA